MGATSPRNNAQQGCLAAAVRPYQADPHARCYDEVQALKQRTISNLEADILKFNQALGLSICRREIDLCGGTPRSGVQVGKFAHQFTGLIDARLGFRVRAFAPRRSHSISGCTRFSKAS